jgi:MATE family, multidrug efflux pump
MYAEPRGAAAGEGVVETGAVDQDQALEPFGRVECKPVADPGLDRGMVRTPKARSDERPMGQSRGLCGNASPSLDLPTISTTSDGAGPGSLAALRIDRAIAGSFFAIGIPRGVQMAVRSLSEVAVVSLVNPFGSSATAAYGAVNQVVGYLLAPMQAVGLAATVFAAQAIGAQKSDRIAAVTRIATLLTILIGVVAVGALSLFSQIVLSWFVVDPVTLSIATRALLITLWSYVVMGIGNVLAGVMRSTGAVLWLAIFAIAAIWLVQLPSAYLLSGLFGVEGICMGYPAGFIAALIAQALYYRLVWRQRPHE